MKRIASEARIDMEALFDSKVFLEVWVKVKSGWADNAATLKRCARLVALASLFAYYYLGFMLVAGAVAVQVLPPLAVAV